MKQPKQPETKSPPKPVVEADDPLVPVVGMTQVKGGWVAFSAVIQGNRVVSRQVHNATPQLREYAAETLRAVILTKLLFPKGSLINVESGA